MTVRIGLTGPIGCGKSTVAGWLGERPGVVVFDADQVAREVVEPGEPALEAVLARFGEGLRRDDGTLDRAALGRIVFSDPAALRDLEAITHPAIRRRILGDIEAAESADVDAVVIEAINQVQGGLAALCDEIWLITCDAADQRRRLTDRGTPLREADQRIAAQADMVDENRATATRTFDTSGDRERTRAMVMDALAGLRQP